ncbi:MAG: hypothetical protein ACO1RX_17935 [Candidatus Sericytochromatia bacterium]
MSFGLGTDTLLNQFQIDSTQFKLVDMATNIQRINSSPAPPASQPPLSSAAYVDYTFSHLNRFMQQDSINDENTVFLFEYQALLRARMQQLITELTSALTRDLDRAMVQTRAIWDSNAALGQRQSAQGYGSDVEDAGAARMAYNFLTGFSSAVSTSDPLDNGAAYEGISTYDRRLNTYVNKVSPDTQADAGFWGFDPTTGGAGIIVRSFGTAVIQQSTPQDGLTEAVIDNLMVNHRGNTTLYEETGGGFSTHLNRYRFTDIEDGAPGDARFNTQNIGFLNPTLADNSAGGTQSGNLNDESWDDGPLVSQYQRFNAEGNAKNEFQRILYDTIFELDQRNLLRDVFRLSEKNGFLNGVQIASTSSLTTGSQIQASLLLNYVPRATGNITASTVNSATLEGGGDIFSAGELVFVTVGGEQVLTTIASVNATSITFTPDLAAPPDVGTTIVTNRPDLGGRIQVVIDRFSAFYHCGGG